MRRGYWLIDKSPKWMREMYFFLISSKFEGLTSHQIIQQHKGEEHCHTRGFPLYYEASMRKRRHRKRRHPSSNWPLCFTPTLHMILQGGNSYCLEVGT